MEDFILAFIWWAMAHLTIGRTVGAMWIAGPASMQSAMSRANPGKFVWFMMIFWVRFYFYGMWEGTPGERRIKIFVMLAILMLFEWLASDWLHEFMAWGWALLIVFVVENILSFPLFIILRCPGYQYLQRPERY